MDNIFKEIGKLQEEYENLVKSKKLTKKAMCDLCIPFRDKYGLSDLQTLQIARKELDIPEIIALFEEKR